MPAWGWDWHERRNAAMMDDATSSETLEAPDPGPAISGFTPINDSELSNTGHIYPTYDNATVESTAADKARAPKRRKTQPSAATTVAKPKKARTSKRAKKTKAAAQLDTRDISQSLLRTKPTPSRDGALRAKTNPSIANTSLGNTGSKDIDETLIESQAVSGRSGITESNHTEPSTLKALEFDSSSTVRDFGAPPFTQLSPPRLRYPDTWAMIDQDDYEPLISISDDLFELRDISNDDHDGKDEFPMNDECFEEIMQSGAIPAEEQPLGFDWEPLDASDDMMYIDGQPGNDQSHWPEALPGSDGVVMYDEGPTLVASDVLNAPSPAQQSSQACILTHVTGNAKPDHARTAEGSENCFDDYDLDESLIDLTADEPKSLQITFPSTPTKRLSSPKLQWLSPKNYTPVKPSRNLTSPASDPRIAPMASAGDVLPFIRSPFPKGVRDRSPILGLSNRTVLRICFRIGEAFNAAAVASRTNIDAIMELYARVVNSSREASGGYKQFFVFGDLFTEKPPYLSGTYTFWKGVGLWDHDSKELVGEQGKGKMVRVLGRIKKKDLGQGQGPGVEMVVLSIWEVDWEDESAAQNQVLRLSG